MNISNAITLARLLAVPLIVYLIVDASHLWAFIVFVLAGASDAVDGTIAKLLGQTSRIGGILDPIADKTLIVGVYVTLGLQGSIAESVVAIVVLRDVLIVFGVGMFLLLNEPMRMRAAQLSRLNTAMQVFLATVVLADLALGLGVPEMIEILSYLVIATTVVSGGWYLVRCGRRLLRLESL